MTVSLIGHSLKGSIAPHVEDLPQAALVVRAIMDGGLMEVRSGGSLIGSSVYSIVANGNTVVISNYDATLSAALAQTGGVLRFINSGVGWDATIDGVQLTLASALGIGDAVAGAPLVFTLEAFLTPGAFQWSNSLIGAPPVFNGPIIIKGQADLDFYRTSLGPSHSPDPLYPAGELFWTSPHPTIPDDADIIFDMRGVTVTEPIKVWNARHVWIVGGKFAPTPDAGGGVGELANFMLSGLEGNKNLYPRIVGGNLLQISCSHLLRVEGGDYDCLGMNIDAIVGHENPGQPIADAQATRRTHLLNCRIRGFRGHYANYDTFGEGLHADAFQFQSELSCYAEILMENVVIETGGQGVIGNCISSLRPGHIGLRNVLVKMDERFIEPDVMIRRYDVFLSADTATFAFENVHIPHPQGWAGTTTFISDIGFQNWWPPAGNIYYTDHAFANGTSLIGVDGLHMYGGSLVDGPVVPPPDTDYAPLQHVGTGYVSPWTVPGSAANPVIDPRWFSIQPGFATVPDPSAWAVLAVTNLNASGAGSLKAAMEAANPRLVVFETSGIIDLAGGTISVQNDDLWVAGQTAPSPGVQVIKGTIEVRQASRAVIQHIGVRLGTQSGTNATTSNAARIEAEKGSRDVILDHLSVSWGKAENIAAGGTPYTDSSPAERVTISNCLVYEPLLDGGSGYPGYAASVDDNCQGVMFLGSLFSHYVARGPLFGGGAVGAVINCAHWNMTDRAVSYSLLDADWPSNPPVGKITAFNNIAFEGSNTTASYGYASIFSNRDSEYYGASNLFYKADEVTTLAENYQSVALSPAGAWQVQGSAPSAPTTMPTLLATGEVQQYIIDVAGYRPWDVVNDVRRDVNDARAIADFVNRVGRRVASETEVGGYPTAAVNTRAFNAVEWDLTTMTPLVPEAISLTAGGGGSTTGGVNAPQIAGTAQIQSEITYTPGLRVPISASWWVVDGKRTYPTDRSFLGTPMDAGKDLQAEDVVNGVSHYSDPITLAAAAAPEAEMLEQWGTHILARDDIDEDFPRPYGPIGMLYSAQNLKRVAGGGLEMINNTLYGNSHAAVQLDANSLDSEVAWYNINSNVFWMEAQFDGTDGEFGLYTGAPNPVGGLAVRISRDDNVSSWDVKIIKYVPDAGGAIEQQIGTTETMPSDITSLIVQVSRIRVNDAGFYSLVFDGAGSPIIGSFTDTTVGDWFVGKMLGNAGVGSPMMLMKGGIGNANEPEVIGVGDEYVDTFWRDFTVNQDRSVIADAVGAGVEFVDKARWDPDVINEEAQVIVTGSDYRGLAANPAPSAIAHDPFVFVPGEGLEIIAREATMAERLYINDQTVMHTYATHVDRIALTGFTPSEVQKDNYERARVSEDNTFWYMYPTGHAKAGQWRRIGARYLSGMLELRGIFSSKYHGFRIRVKGAKGPGVWFAGWWIPTSMLDAGEIDSYETASTVLAERGTWTGNTHLPDPITGAYSIPSTQQPSGFVQFPVGGDGTDDHCIENRWQEDGIRWALDGREAHRAANVSWEDMTLLLSLSVANGNDGFQEEYGPETPDPIKFLIRSLHVAQRPSQLTKGPTVTSRPVIVDNAAGAAIVSAGAVVQNSSSSVKYWRKQYIENPAFPSTTYTYDGNDEDKLITYVEDHRDANNILTRVSSLPLLVQGGVGQSI